MKYLITLTALLLAGSIQAETIHGICDDLAREKGSLYGLCVAICEVPAESQECQPVFVDGVLDMTSLDKCRPASPALVDKFIDKADGYPLPCGDYVSSASCPCTPPPVEQMATYDCRQSYTQLTMDRAVTTSGQRGAFLVNRATENCFVFGLGVGVQILPMDGAEIDACENKYIEYCGVGFPD